MRSLAFGLGLALCGPALADTTFLMTSSSETVAYGVLVMAPETDCPASRVIVRGSAGTWKSGTLQPGQLAVVRMGKGFSQGEHALRIETAGCSGAAFPARRVVLHKQSPDHAWRAATRP